MREFFSRVLDNDGSVLLDVDKKLGEWMGDDDMLRCMELWRYHDLMEEFPELSDVDSLEYDPIKLEDEWGIELPEWVVEEVDERADVILNFEHAVLKGDILEATEHGVIGTHGSDITRYRGRPSGFWQYLRGEEEVGVTLQRLTPDLDGGHPIVIKHVEVEEGETFYNMKRRQMEAMESIFTEGIERLQDPEFEVEPAEELGELTYAKDARSWRRSGRILVSDMKARMF